MSEAQTLRLSILQQSDGLGSKKRFGLFSQPISTAIGDNGAYNKKFHPRDPSTKKPITQLRNFYVSPTKSGQGNKSYFGPLNSLANSHVKDQYLEPGKRLIKQQKQARQKGKNQVSFFTGAGTKLLSSPAYEYIESKDPPLDPKRHRDSDGKVKSEFKNFYTNPNSRVENTFFKSYKHIDDPYDRAVKMEKEINKRNKSLEGESKFRPNNFSPQIFNLHKSVYGQDKQIKKKQPKPQKLNIYKHQNSWKSSNPNKSGLYGFFTPFPQYKQSPLPEKKRQPVKQKLKDAFKINNPQHLATPSCSITLHKTNIRRSLGR